MDEYRIFEKYYIADKRDITDYAPAFGVRDIQRCTFSGKENALKVLCDNLSTGTRKSVTFDLSGSRYAGADALAVSFYAEQGVNRLAVKVEGEGGSRETVASIAPLRWNTVTLSGEFFVSLGALKSMELSAYCDGLNESKALVFYVADAYFGRLLDLEFTRGNYENIICGDGKIERTDGGLKWTYEAGDTLVLVNYSDTAGSLLDFTFGVKDSVYFYAEDFTEDAEYAVEFESVEAKYAGCRRLSFPHGKNYALVDLSGCGAPYGLKLKTLRLKSTECGSITLRSVRFEQEHDTLCDESAAEFILGQKPPRIREFYARPKNKANVRDFGAKGDGYHDDTAAINYAIEKVHALGGGTVFLEEGRYLATCVRLLSGVRLNIDDSAILVQSHRAADYPYEPSFGHDSPTATCNWGHNFLVHNYPLVYADRAEFVAVTGGGRIRMYDGANAEKIAVNPDWGSHCEGIIHCIPLGFNKCRNVVVGGVTVNRANSYNMLFSHCDGVRVLGVKMYDVRCLSADGIGLSCSKNVLIDGCTIVTNDDGVTLVPFYDDPRGRSWWQCTPGEDNCVRGVEVARSYVNSGYGGGGKAIAFIPWGSDAPDQTKQLISDIYVHDCILSGGHSVGTWCDNPYNGKQPFDNTETDDYSPVTRVRILRNEYRSKVDLLTVKTTFMKSDCGLKSASEVVNGDFLLGLSNWKAEGGVNVRGSVCLMDAESEISEGLYLRKGEHKLKVLVRGNGRIVVGRREMPFDFTEFGDVILPFKLTRDRDLTLKIVAGSGCEVRKVRLL